MTKHEFRPLIIVEAPDAAAARNVILKILATAELSEKIFHFTVPEPTAEIWETDKE